VIVVDTNVIAYFLIRGDYSDKAKELFKYDSDWIAPYLWRSEFRNVLILYFRKGFISLEEVIRINTLAENLIEDKEFVLNSEEILELALKSNCSAYDCEFVALAKSTGLRLYTADNLILKEFPEYSLSLKDFNTKIII
jgi:predicted nucleic acid-binding protein